MYGMELSEKVRKYQNTGKGWEELKNRLILFIYQWALKKKNLGEEKAADFLLSFMPRIKSLIKNYNHYECPFEHYVKVCLEWHTVRFHTTREKDRKKEELYWQSEGRQDIWEACQPQALYEGRKKEDQPQKELPPFMKEETFRKRFLRYLLYHVNSIDYARIDSYATCLGMKEKQLMTHLRQAEEMIKKQREKRNLLMERKRGYFIDHKYQEMKLKITEEQQKKEEIRFRMETLRRKMENLMVRMDRIKLTPSTEQVGKLTACSASTVGRDIKFIGDHLDRLNAEKGGIPPEE
ncbi:MAG: hypothetical protein PQJ60_12785 [Spirochaetales bacterium]|nr:hypothetical protein [Spirochaetales bacterium]